MRNRNMDGMGWGSRIAIALGVLIVLGVIGLAVYGGRVQPHTHPVDQVVPNDRLPN